MFLYYKHHLYLICMQRRIFIPIPIRVQLLFVFFQNVSVDTSGVNPLRTGGL